MHITVGSHAGSQKTAWLELRMYVGVTHIRGKGLQRVLNEMCALLLHFNNNTEHVYREKLPSKPAQEILVR